VRQGGADGAEGSKGGEEGSKEGAERQPIQYMLRRRSGLLLRAPSAHNSRPPIPPPLPLPHSSLPVPQLPHLFDAKRATLPSPIVKAGGAAADGAGVLTVATGGRGSAHGALAVTDTGASAAAEAAEGEAHAHKRVHH
jgi:hypothetical protein